MAFSPAQFSRSLDSIDPGWRDERHCVACSGGLDSTVLLHALAVLARGSRIPVRVLHVDHGLQAGSGDWARACAEECAQLGVECSILRLALAPDRGESIEAAARAARYAALAEALGDGERLHVAQHADDQLETVLIQLLRGAGLPGLAAMPARAAFGPGLMLRPLLGFAREELARWARAEGLRWRDDPMNADLRFDRAWLRARVLPALRERWPAAAATVARSAGHASEAARLLDDLARADAAGMLDQGRLSVAGLAALPRERQANVLRWWLRSEGLRPPSTARLSRGLADLLGAREDGAPRIAWDGGEVRRYRGRLYAQAALTARLAMPARVADADWELGDGLGCLQLVAGRDGGLCAALAAEANLRFRAGGESLRPHPERPRKRLKDLCQEAGIVPWMRDRLPLVYVGERLAAVGDLWIDADFAAGAGDPALRPVWTGRPRIY
jgi:tRNA(Ile)-lysidine synthase